MISRSCRIGTTAIRNRPRWGFLLLLSDPGPGQVLHTRSSLRPVPGPRGVTTWPLTSPLPGCVPRSATATRSINTSPITCSTVIPGGSSLVGRKETMKRLVTIVNIILPPKCVHVETSLPKHIALIHRMQLRVSSTTTTLVVVKRTADAFVVNIVGSFNDTVHSLGDREARDRHNEHDAQDAPGWRHLFREGRH